MAQKKIVEVEIKENLDKVDKKIDNVVQSLTEVKQTADKVGDSLNKVEKEVNDISVAGGKASGALKRMGSAINDIGGNIKGIGLGVLVSQFDDFKDAVTSSNKVTDFYNNTLNVTKKLAGEFGDLVFSGEFFSKTGTAIKDFITNPTETINKAKKSLAEIQKQAEDLTKEQNKAMFAAIEQQGIFEKYDKQAEEQRLIRDNEFVPLEKRNEANDKLAKILADQKREMLEQADIQEKAAKAAFDLTKKREDDLKYREAVVNKLGIEAQLQGFITEQGMAANALSVESMQINSDKIKTEIDLDKTRLDTTNSIIKSDKERLENEKFNLKRSLEEWAKFYEDQLKLHEKGTSGRAQLENEANLKLEEIRTAIKINEDQTRTYLYNRDQELRQNVINNELEAFSTRLFALQKFNEEAQASTQVSEDEKRRIQLETFQQERVLQNQRLAMISNTMGNISSLFDAASTEGKAFAVAQALINTYQGITAELATKTATPFEFGLKLANVATTAAMGFKAVKDIISVQPSSTGGGMEMSGPSGGAAPQFNVVGTSGINQIAQTINAKDNQPVKAFVVASEVTSQQSLDRNRVATASLG